MRSGRDHGPVRSARWVRLDQLLESRNTASTPYGRCAGSWVNTTPFADRPRGAQIAGST